MKIDYPRKDITKFLLSTPSYITGGCKTDWYYLIEAFNDHSQGSYRPFEDERIFKHYVELAVLTPEYDDGLIIPNYSQIADNFCSVLAVLYGKRFDSHGLIQQHRRMHVPTGTSRYNIYNKNLCFNSNHVRADYGFELDLKHFKKFHSALMQRSGEFVESQKTFLYAARFYSQSLRQVETSPEIAFLSLITVSEILAAHFKYPIGELIDEDTMSTLQQLRSIPNIGEKLANKVEKNLYGISESVCKFVLDCLDDDFFLRGEAIAPYDRLQKDGIKQRLKAAYNMRSQFVHAGRFQSNWMSVNYLNKNEEIESGNPVIEDPATRKMIKRSPTFIGLERIIRYCLIKFLLKEKLIDEFIVNNA